MVLMASGHVQPCVRAALVLLICTQVFPVGVYAQGGGSQERPAPRICTGGVLNSRVIAEVKPAYPTAAKRARAEGNVIVRVRIDEEGRVYDAVACVGHRLLRRATEDASYRTRLSPTLLSGEAVKVAGVLVYVFRRGEKTGRLSKL